MATEDDVREVALALPEVSEGTWYGTPGYTVRGKGFLRFRTAEEGALVVLVADESEKQALLADDPDVFFTTPHYDGHASVLVRVEAVDTALLAELVAGSWRQKAPKRLVRALDDDLDGDATDG